MVEAINKKTWIYITLAFAFSVAVRLIWIYQFHGVEDFIWNDQFMINTNDGYFWAEGARDILNWDFSEFALSPVERASAQLTAFFAFVLPFSFETVILYLPVFLSSLVVIPMILIAQNLKRVEVGFVAALLASIAWSYYNRTMVGYFDTDMLNIVFPTFLLWSLILAIQTKEEKYLLFTALEIVAYRWWYPQSYSLEFAFFGLILAYTIFLAIKDKSFKIQHLKFNIALLSIMLFAMMGLPSFVRLVTVVAVYLLYRSKKLDSYMYYLLGIAFLLFMATGGFAPIWEQLKGYVFGDSIKVIGEDLQLHFFSVTQTVREAGKIPFETFANRISGHTATFALSIVGYILLVFRYRVMLIGLPMIGLGFLAYVGGLRFTIYAVPVLAFGISYLIFFCADYIKSSYAKVVFISTCTVAILYPNIMHVVAYKVPTVFTKQEVTVLDKLKKVAKREDYVVAWWDYGYPLRYYSDINTLIDGGKHSGAVSFPISYMLTNPQESAAKLARFDVEYTEQRFLMREEDEDRNRTNIANMTLDSDFHDTNDFLNSLHVEIPLPKKTRDIYFYLPYRMMGIMPTVARFSDIDLMNGKTNRRPFFYQSTKFKDSGSILNLSNGVLFNKTNGTLKVGTQEVKVKEVLTVAYDKNKKLMRERQSLHKDGKFYLVYMRSYNSFLVLDEAMLNSTYIQLFVFENYDKNLFEPVILDPSAKVFKLKI